MRSIRSTILLVAVAAVAATTLVAGSAPADAAFYSQGVKQVLFHESTDSCARGQLGCTTNAGTGTANVLRIVQKPKADGSMRFAGYESTGKYTDNLWLAATLSAECRTGYSLYTAAVRPGWVYETYALRAPDEVVPGWDGISVSVPDAKSMPAKKLAINVPVSAAFEGADHPSIVHDFDTLAQVYAYGEQRIAQRIAAGSNEAGSNEAMARAEGFQVLTWVALRADVRCDGNVRGRIFVKKMPRYIPLTIDFRPHHRAPISRGDEPTTLSSDATVTDASLVVVPDPDDPCTLHLSGTIEANGDTEVRYRFVDQWGQRSNMVTVDVGQGVPEFVSHEVDVPGTGLDGGPGGTLTSGDATDGIGGYTTSDDRDATGTYQLEVFSPNHRLSNVDGFSVPPCPAGSPTQLSGLIPGLRAA